MRLPLPIACFIFSCLASCSPFTKKSPAESITGNWLLVYPQHRLKNSHQRKLYARYQDSDVKLYGLKLISFLEGGEFTETDSLIKPGGKWLLTNDSRLKIQEGGKGFNPFAAQLDKVEGNSMLLTQNILLEDEKIALVWHLKKITGDDGADSLFGAEANNWRQRPVQAETEPALQKRLAAMLNYYSVYFILIAKEANYFVPSRVPLPFSYYQHGVGLNPDLSTTFKRFFYDEAQAHTAYFLLEQAMAAHRQDFPVAKNFGTEYGRYFKLLAETLRK